MAISRGAGTEIIRSAHFKDISGTTPESIIVGEQHHIYTVLSVIVHCTVTYGANTIQMHLLGYDTDAGTTAQEIQIFDQLMVAKETFVWNDKFSFNGFEPVDFTAGLDATKQNAIADQGSSVAQHLQMESTNDADGYEVHVTYIDQNNA